MSRLRPSVVFWASCALIPASALPGAARAGAGAAEAQKAGPLARGGEIFSREWVPADPRSHGGDGLGPVYNETSCASCHGLGAPGGAGPVNKNAVILSLLSTPGTQAASASPQDVKALTAEVHPGFLKARSVVLHRAGVDPEYKGWLRSLTAESVEDAGPANGPVRRQARRAPTRAPAGVADEIAALVAESPSPARTFTVTRSRRSFRITVSERNTPPLFGAGLLDAVPAKVLGETAEGQEVSIRGRVHKMAGGRVGRFGWKAQTATLREFVLAACAGELGLEVPGQHQAASPLDPDSVAKGYDLSQSDCDSLIAYVRVMPAPVELRPSGAGSLQLLDEGRNLFEIVGCAGCHTPNLGEVKGIYSDLLLHNMGQSLNDGGEYYGDGSSPGAPNPSEWRTPPLWGFRDSGPYLHDGRARTLDEAVAHHEGQGAESSRKFFSLSAASRLRIESFLKSLVAPPADAASADPYGNDRAALAARRLRAETEQKMLDEGLAEQLRVAAETLSEAHRFADQSRSEAAAEARRLAERARQVDAAGLARAENKLRTGLTLERAGKIRGALEFYREVARDFPDSAAGRAATERLTALSR